MSKATLDLCTFTTPSGTTYGVKAYDDYAKAYDNLMEKEQYDQIMAVDETTRDQLTLDYAMGSDDAEMQGLLEAYKDGEEGISVNGTYYDPDELGT